MTPEQPVEQTAAPETAAPGTAEIESQPAEKVLEVDAAEQILVGEIGDAGMAAGIVFGALLGIVQNGVSLGDLPELLGRAGFLVAVRMVFQGELAEGVLDRLSVGVAGDAQHLVVVPRLRQGLCRPLALDGVRHAWTRCRRSLRFDMKSLRLSM